MYYTTQEKEISLIADLAPLPWGWKLILWKWNSSVSAHFAAQASYMKIECEARDMLRRQVVKKRNNKKYKSKIILPIYVTFRKCSCILLNKLTMLT